MNNFYTELDTLKKSLKTQTLLVIIIVILSPFSCLICYNLGRIDHEQEIIKRAKELPENVDCYTNADVEKLIFGEPQL